MAKNEPFKNLPGPFFDKPAGEENLTNSVPIHDLLDRAGVIGDVGQVGI
jgi:hypothetical protein